MKKLILLTSLLVGLSHSAFGKEITSEDLARYIDFVQEASGRAYNGEPLPQVKIIRHEMVQIYAYGDFEYAQAEYDGKKLPTINAIYEPTKKTIFISDKADVSARDFEVTLVHELTHYLQDISGYTASLNGHIECTESEAYDVQMIWQKDHNHGAEAMNRSYQTGLLKAMQCMGDQSSAFPKLKDVPSLRDFKQ